jgi:FkbM family methyltransferase
MLIPLEDIVKEFKTNIKGVVHIGAHDCEEKEAYAKCGIHYVIWIEGMKFMYEKMRKMDSNLCLYNEVISEEDCKEVEFIITNNLQSSSILELEDHKKYHSWVKEIARYKVKTITMDTFVKENNIDVNRFNMLNIDIQGAELLALKGSKELLKTIDYLYLEVNTSHLYKNCALIGELDEYLKDYGFVRVKTVMTEFNWGDAFYIKY